MKNAILAKGINLMLYATSNKKANWKNKFGSKLKKYLQTYRKPQFLPIWKIMYSSAKNKSIKLYERPKGNIIKDYKTISCLVGQAPLFTSYHYTRGSLLTLEAQEKRKCGITLNCGY